MDSTVRSTNFRSRERLSIVLLLAVIVLLAHFLRFHEFGLYEDDAWSVAPHMGDSLNTLWDQAAFHFRHWWTGRPLNYFLPAALGAVGHALGGLEATYLIGACWLTLNAFLAYLIARRFFPPIPALATGLVYILFPADTTKILLVHVAHIQGAMTFALAGILLWTYNGWHRRASYVVGGLSLLSYETAYLPFLCAPLLLGATAETRRLRTWALHAIGCSTVLGVVGVIRLSTGDSRAAEALGNMTTALYRAGTSMFIGPATSGLSFLRAVVVGYTRADLSVLLLALLFLGLTANLVIQLRMQSDAAPSPDPKLARRAVMVGGAALITWAVSYVLTLTNYPPNQDMGRLTSTHTAAGWPVALLAGSIVSRFVAIGHSRADRRVLAGAAFVLAGLFAYHQYIQSEYVRAWKIEKKFWSQIVELAPDLNSTSSVIVTGTPDPNGSAVIAANSWADGVACQRIFGSNGKMPHFAHLGLLGSMVTFRKTADKVEWRPEPWASQDFLPIDPANLILLHSDNGTLRRVESLDLPIGTLRAVRQADPNQRGAWPDTVVARIFQR